MADTYNTIVALIGMPRSGTSWLGQLFDSSPEVCYRLEPIFSYAFKNVVGEHSTKQEYEQFFDDIYRSQDEFLLQVDKRQAGTYPVFYKRDNLPFLAFKTTRFHQLMETILGHFDNLKMVSIVRHPCGAICSWLNTPREIPASADPRMEWRSGACRKTAKEEFWGFEDWKIVTRLHLRLQVEFPDKFTIIRYEDLVSDTNQVLCKVFDFVGLAMHEQTRRFIKSCHARHDNDSYSVFKSKQVVDTWRTLLPVDIQQSIISEISGTDLAIFL